MRKIIKFTFMLIIFSWTLSCGQNHHITSSENSSQAPFIKWGAPLSIATGANTFTGNCFPDGIGTITVSAPGALPNSIGPCDCSGGSYTCNVNFTSVPIVPPLMIATNSTGGSITTDDFTPLEFVDLDPPGSLSLGTPITLAGSCFPDGSAVNISNPGALPNSIGPCSCILGSFTCSPTSFTQLPESLTMTAVNGSASDIELPLIPPTVDLTLDASDALPGELIPIAGTCFPDSTGSVSFSADSSVMTPNDTITCDCASGTIVNCVDSSLTAITSVSFSETDGITTNITTAGGTSGDTDSVAFLGASSLFFGRPSASYGEDGHQGYCIKSGPRSLSCTSDYSELEDASTYLPAGVTIDSISFLEHVGFIFASDGSTYSRIYNSSALPSLFTFNADSPSRPVYAVGHHTGSSCFLHEDGDVSCQNNLTSNFEQIDQNARDVYVGQSYAGYIDSSDNLYIRSYGSTSSAIPSFSSTIAATGVAAHIDSGVIPWRHSLTLYLNGDTAYGTFASVGTTRHTANPHTGPTTATTIGRGSGYIDTNGQVVHASAALSVVTAMGTNNIDLDSSMHSEYGFHFVVLDNTGKVYGAASSIANLNKLGATFGNGAYDDFIAIKGMRRDICAIRSNLEVYCAGHNAGGSWSNPILLGTASR